MQLDRLKTSQHDRYVTENSELNENVISIPYFRRCTCSSSGAGIFL